MTTEPWFAENLDWTEKVDWSTSPALAYSAGLRHGAQLERERQAALDDAEHRAAVRKAIHVIETADARALADAGRSE